MPKKKIVVTPKPKKELADGMIFSVYPSEAAELKRLQEVLKLRTPFDVVRTLLHIYFMTKPGTIRAPKKALPLTS